MPNWKHVRRETLSHGLMLVFFGFAGAFLLSSAIRVGLWLAGVEVPQTGGTE